MRRIGANPAIDPVGAAMRPHAKPFRVGQKPSLIFAPSEVAEATIRNGRLHSIPLKAKKPRAFAETAVVTGYDRDPGVLTGPMARVCVKFIWDRRNKRNEEASCWTRCDRGLRSLIRVLIFIISRTRLDL